MKEPKLVDPQEILDLGIAQEINRLLLHPLGMEFALLKDKHTGKATSVLGIIDNRDKQGGVVFNPDLLDPKKKKAFENMGKKNEEYRKQNLGSVIQPMR